MAARHHTTDAFDLPRSNRLYGRHDHVKDLQIPPGAHRVRLHLGTVHNRLVQRLVLGCIRWSYSLLREIAIGLVALNGRNHGEAFDLINY